MLAHSGILKQKRTEVLVTNPAGFEVPCSSLISQMLSCKMAQK